jgi:hypothetical protein
MRRTDSHASTAEGATVSGTCGEIGFSNFSTTHFQFFTRLKTDLLNLA